MEEEKQLSQLNRYRIQRPTRSKCFNLYTFLLSNPKAFVSLTLAVSGLLLYVFKDSPFFTSFIINLLSKFDFVYSLFFIITVFYLFPVIYKFCSVFLKNRIMCASILLFAFHVITTFLVGYFQLLSHSKTILSKNFKLFSTKLKDLVTKTFMDFDNLLQEFLFDAQTNPQLARDFIHDLRLVMDNALADGASFILFSYLYLSNMHNLDITTTFFQMLRQQISKTEDTLFIDEFELDYEDIKKNVQELTVSKIEEYTQAFLASIYSYVGTDIIIVSTEEEKQHEELLRQVNLIKKNKQNLDVEYTNLIEQILERSSKIKSYLKTSKSQQEKNMYIEELNHLNKVIEKSLLYSAQLEKIRNIKYSLNTFIGEMEKAVVSFDKFNINFYQFMGGLDNETGHIVNETVIQFKKVLQHDSIFQDDTPITIEGEIIKWLDFSKAISNFILKGETPMQNLRDGGDNIITDFLIKLQSSSFIEQTKFLKKFINDKRFDNFISKFRFNYIMLLEEVAVTLSADRYLLLKDLKQTFEIKTGLLNMGEKIGRNILGTTAGIIEGVQEATGLEILNVEEYEKNIKDYINTLHFYQNKIEKELTEKTKEIAINYASGYIPDCIVKDECITLIAQPTNRLDSPVSVSIVLPTISILFMVIIVILGIFKRNTCCPRRQQYRFVDDEDTEKNVLDKMKQVFY